MEATCVRPASSLVGNVFFGNQSGKLGKILEDRRDGVKLSDFESALIGRIMLLRSRNEFVVPDSVLSVLDEE